MKAFMRILFHPAIICFLFCFLIISGESNAAFYAFILLIGLPHAVLHSLLGTAGIFLMLASIVMQKKKQLCFFRICGAICFILSLVRFFTQLGADYNYPTFHQSLPLILLSAFLIVVVFSIVYNIRLLISLRHSV